MGARLQEMPNEDILVMGARPYQIKIGDQVVFIVIDQEQAATIVRLLNVAKDEGKHNAMNILCEKLHFSESRAEQLWMDLKVSESPSPASYTVN